MKVEVQALAGREVRDPNGRIAGRIHAIHAERIGPQCVVQEYHLGAAGIFSRLGIYTRHLVGWAQRHQRRVPWTHLDLTDPQHPLLRCSVEELDALQSTLPPLE